MTQVQGIPYRRHGPTAALRQFLDPLDPGDYFDCGRARLHGLDDALLDEARARGRSIGDDDFLLVATDMGLIYCRPSISFALAARWEDITITRPRGKDPVVLPVAWPRHGELKFTLSKRLAGNIFRRWLQLRMHSTRRAREAAAESGRHRPQSLGLGTGPVEVGAPAPARSTGPQPAVVAALIGDATSDPVSGAAAVADDRPVTLDAGPEVLADGELERVTVPRSQTLPATWIGSVVSLVAVVVVLSTVVLVAAVSISLVRSGQTGDGAVEVAATDVTVVDHERFRPSAGEGSGEGSESVLRPAGEVASPTTSVPTDSTDPTDPGSLPPSAPGGASQVLTPSRQQLLAIPADGTSSVGPADGVDEARRCDSNYSGCVPDVDHLPQGDVDCPAGGVATSSVDDPATVDGPYFADGEVTVLGDDHYGLDPDGDGRACEPDEFGPGPEPTP